MSTTSLDQIIPKLSLAVVKHRPVVLIQQDRTSETKEFNDALFVKIDNDIIDIQTQSDYKVNNTNLTLKDIVFCLLHSDTPSSEYIQLANSKNITTLTFGQRTKLISLLSDPHGLAEPTTSTETTLVTKKQKLDPVYEKVKSHEREVANDYRGKDDFAYLIKLSQVKIIEQLKHKPSSSSSKSRPSSSSSNGGVSSQHDISKDPIIILSPAASSILNLSNIARFLQDSQFEPPTITTNSNGVVKIKKQTKFGPMSFLLIDSTEKFFNKPDYWKRVVAIFTTGQKWQFKNYQISNPSELFRNYPGFYASSGEPIPSHVKDWGNVNVLNIDKYNRFRDKQIVESFWGIVERYMTYRGYGSKK